VYHELQLEPESNLILTYTLFLCRFPKTYPMVAAPIFNITKPINGVSNDQVNALTHAISAEAHRNKGAEMVFQVREGAYSLLLFPLIHVYHFYFFHYSQIVDFCQDWLTKNIHPATEAPGSLAFQMNLRAADEERLKRERDEADKIEREDRERQRQEMYEREAMEAMRAFREKEQMVRGRRRANSGATEMPDSPLALRAGPFGHKDDEDEEHLHGERNGERRSWDERSAVSAAADTMLESFGKEITVDGITFTTVRLFHPRQDCFGTIYLADPICDDINASLPLELLVVTFQASYYGTSQGRKKLKQLEGEIQRMVGMQRQGQENLTRVFAVKLVMPQAHGYGGQAHKSAPTQLMVLSEQAPTLTLGDVLEDCESLKEERATVCH
jgi:eukaryotic translation initiation factor 2-alpha kinase 4